MRVAGAESIERRRPRHAGLEQECRALCGASMQLGVRRCSTEEDRWRPTSRK